MKLENENVIHVKNKDIEYLQFKELLKYDDIIAHCFTLPPLDFGNNDTYQGEKRIILENYKKICKCLKIDCGNIVRPLQIHSHNIKEVNKIGVFAEGYTGVDGLISTEPNQILSLTYADCIPLYFFDVNKKIIANIHSGWQGTLKRVGEIAARKLINEYNCNGKDIICVIGPSIRKCHFEVDEGIAREFRERFSDISDVNDIILKGNIVSGEQKYYIDTVELNKKMMIKAGLSNENIIDSEICTVCNSDMIYSYRGNNKTTCRNTSLICIR